MERSEELSMDNAFLQKLTTAVFDNLNNDQFGTEDLAKEVGLSRSQIHRKLHRLNGKSVSQFIREVRLEEAHKLLEADAGASAEIAYQVGFSSPAYFGECFIEYFGYTPGQVKVKKKDYQKVESGREGTTVIPIQGKEVSPSRKEGKEYRKHTSTARRLAAIMFTDIVGYTKLMGSDEDRAFEVLRKNRENHLKYIEIFNGALIKEIGDGILASFDQASAAVLCAMELEQASKEHNIQLRIGIHEGEVVFEDGDVFGDGVNIASRLQSIADPGGIYISESLQKSIRSKRNIRVKYLGKCILKNVDYPVKTYAIQGGGLPVPVTSRIRRFFWKDLKERKLGSVLQFLLVIFLIVALGWWIKSSFMPEPMIKPTLLVLPVSDFTGDTQDWFIDGMHASLVGEIQKISGIQVISDWTSRTYKNSNKSVPEIASEINATFVATASFLSIGTDRVRFQIALHHVDKAEKLIWKYEYETDISQILNWHNKVTKTIAEKINVELTPREEKLLAESRTVNPKAYEAYLRGMYCVEKGTKTDLDNAMEHFQLALKIDSTYALVYSGISWAWGIYSQHGFLPDSITEPKWDEAARKALELDSTLVEVQGRILLHEMYSAILCGKWNDINRRFRKIIDINPNYAKVLAFYGHFLGVIGRPSEGLNYSYQAIEIDPLNELIQAIHAFNLKNARNYYEAHQVLQGLLNTNPNNTIGLPTLWAVYHEEGKYTEALSVAKEIYKMKVNDPAIKAMEAGYTEGGYQMAMQRIAERMISYRDSVFSPSYQISTLYARSGLKNETLNWLWKAYEEQDGNIIVIGLDPLFDILREEPRFKELLAKMNLPID